MRLFLDNKRFKLIKGRSRFILLIVGSFSLFARGFTFGAL